MTVAFRSIGCRTNQEETVSLRARLVAEGHVVIDDVEDADIVIVNTCSVTSWTESKTRRFIKSISKDAPNAKILVTGCFAQQHGEAVLEYPGVAWVVGNNDKCRIPSLISALKTGAFLSADGDVFWEDEILGPNESGRTRFSMKIQEGCDFHCSYCIVPSLRGHSRSASESRLIDTFKRAVDMGYREIVLTGTHIGQYRVRNGEREMNPYSGGGLESLLEQLLKISGDYRIRLSSLDPRDLTDSLIDLVGTDSRVCDHLHVSVQSLSAPVLSRMSRLYLQLDLLMDRLRRFREKYPRAGLGGDFIVGHPGEDDAAFEETLRNTGLIGFTYGHVFRYSKRVGTPSAAMPDQVPDSIKKKRSDRLRDRLRQNRNFFLSLLFDAPLCIIIEGESPLRGISGNYLKVEVPGTVAPKNTLMRVILTGEVRDGHCIAKPVNQHK